MVLTEEQCFGLFGRRPFTHRSRLLHTQMDSKVQTSSHTDDG